MKNCGILLTLLMTQIYFASTLFAQGPAPFLTPETEQGIATELSRFFHSQNQEVSDYIRDLPQKIQQLVDKEENRFKQSQACESKIQIDFLDSLPKTAEGEISPRDSEIKDFESGFIRILATRCFRHAEPSNLIRIANDPIFKKQNFSTLLQVPEVNKQQNGFCEKTDAPTIGMSHYCYQLIFNTEKAEYQTATAFYNYNDPSLEFDAQVYFAHVMMSAKKINAQDSALHLVSYMRTTKFGTFQRFFGKGVIEDTQNAVFDALAKQKLN